MIMTLNDDNETFIHGIDLWAETLETKNIWRRADKLMQVNTRPGGRSYTTSIDRPDHR